MSRVTNVTQGANDSSYSLKVYEQVVEITTTAGAPNSFTIYLPSVAEAVGRFYSIRLATRGDDEVVTIADLDDSIGWADITNMDAEDDAVLLYSDGKKWWVVKNDIS